MNPLERGELARLSITEARRKIADTVTEADFQQHVMGLAGTRGYLCHHVYDSRRSNPGFPDVFAAKDGRLVALELKTMRGRPTPEQLEWLRLLATVPGVTAQLWRPNISTDDMLQVFS